MKIKPRKPRKVSHIFEAGSVLSSHLFSLNRLIDAKNLSSHVAKRRERQVFQILDTWALWDSGFAFVHPLPNIFRYLTFDRFANVSRTNARSARLDALHSAVKPNADLL
jgi:hypothetical protein